MPLDTSWFTEVAPGEGIALSLKGAVQLHAEKTPWQSIVIYETETFGTLMVIDDCVMLTDRDNFIYHEMLGHPVLYIHEAPRAVLIVGGGDCGTLSEVLKHPEVGTVTQVEIDERVTRLAEEYFPELCQSNGDSRATLLFGDGIRWVQEAASESLDVIIIDSTDPTGPAQGLFSTSFYQECRRILRHGGLLVQQSESPLIYVHVIRKMHREFRYAGFTDVKTLTFPQPTYPSGWWSATLASKDGEIRGFREADVERRNFVTHYYNSVVHQAAFALPAFLKEALVKS